MRSHRLSSIFVVEPRMPQPDVPQPTSQGFVLLPVQMLGPTTPEHLMLVLMAYQRALEEARAVVRPSLPERDLPGVWN